MGAPQYAMVAPPGGELGGAQGEFSDEVGELAVVGVTAGFKAQDGDGFGIPTTWVGRGLGEAYREVLDAALRQTSRVGAVFTAVDKPAIDVVAGKIRHRRVWDFYLHPRAPERLQEPSLLMAQLLDKGMDAFAPRAPF